MICRNICFLNFINQHAKERLYGSSKKKTKPKEKGKTKKNSETDKDKAKPTADVQTKGKKYIGNGL